MNELDSDQILSLVTKFFPLKIIRNQKKNHMSKKRKQTNKQTISQFDSNGGGM